MIQYRIANSIKKLETIEDSLRFFESAKKEEEECLSNLISTYMQQCTAEENLAGKPGKFSSQSFLDWSSWKSSY